MLLQFEKELAQAVEALTKEQEKAAQAEREKQTQVVKPFENAVMLPTTDWLSIDCWSRCWLSVNQDVDWGVDWVSIEGIDRHLSVDAFSNVHDVMEYQYQRRMLTYKILIYS